ncbi:MAG: sporulation protein [Hyphomonadaceae bacterium]|nr:sporulation protein [Clostridia bacterium]
MDQNLTQSVDTLFTNMENFTQKEGLIGKPVIQGDKTFLPVMSVTLGYGGGNSSAKNQQGTAGSANGAMNTSPGGAVGLGAKIATDAIILIDNDNVSMVPVNTKGNFSQLIDKIPQIVTNMNGQSGQNSNQNQNNANGQNDYNQG